MNLEHKKEYDSLSHLKDSKTGYYDLKLHSKKRREVAKKMAHGGQFMKDLYTTISPERKAIYKSKYRHVKKEHPIK